MISIKAIFKRETLHRQGTLLTKIITQKLVSSSEVCEIDFDGITHIEPVFFQEFIFPLTIEFGSDVLKERLNFLNLNAEHLAIFNEACNGAGPYIENLFVRYNKSFGDISNITCELMIKAREIARRDEMAARAIFGINKDMIGLIANMDIEMIRRISNAGLICFEPRFSIEFAAKMASLEASEIDMFLNIAGNIEGVYEPEFS